MQEAVTFLILLLYNPGFKFSFGAALLPFYASMAAHPKQHPIAKAMDRLTVQIFNSEVQAPSFRRLAACKLLFGATLWRNSQHRLGLGVHSAAAVAIVAVGWHLRNCKACTPPAKSGFPGATEVHSSRLLGGKGGLERVLVG